MGYPHLGQAKALSETEFEHSGQLISAITFPPYFKNGYKKYTYAGAGGCGIIFMSEKIIPTIRSA